MHPQLKQYSLYTPSHQHYSSHIPLLQHCTLYIPASSASSVLVTCISTSALLIMLVKHTSTSPLSLHITHITILNFGTIITSASILYFSTTDSSHHHPQFQHYSLYTYFSIIHYTKLYFTTIHYISPLQHYTFLTSASSTSTLFIKYEFQYYSIYTTLLQHYSLH